MMDSNNTAATSSPAAERPVANEALGSSKSPTPQTMILVCEDEVLIRGYLVDLLEEMGYGVLEAANVVGAIEQMSNTRIDLLITDLGLPDMPGIELARRLRNYWPLLPVLFATGRSREDSGAIDGNTGYLAKPFTMKTLEAALAKLFKSATVSGI